MIVVAAADVQQVFKDAAGRGYDRAVSESGRHLLLPIQLTLDPTDPGQISVAFGITDPNTKVVRGARTPEELEETVYREFLVFLGSEPQP